MTERQSARMSKIKNSGLDQYGAEPFEQQQFGTAGGEGVNSLQNPTMRVFLCDADSKLASVCLSSHRKTALFTLPRLRDS